jgi:hypothetical protein
LLASVVVTSLPIRTRLLLFGLRTHARGAQPLHHQRRIGAARQLETQPNHQATAVLRIRHGRPNAEMARHDEERAALGLQLEAGHSLDPELVGHQALLGQGIREQRLRHGIVDSVQARAGQGEVHPACLGVEHTPRTHQGTLDTLQNHTVVDGHVVANPARDGPVPDVRLPGEEVDQARPRRDEAEGLTEVARVLGEVFEQRPVHAQAPRDVEALVPVTPVLVERTLQARMTVVVERRRLAQQATQSSLDLAESEVLRDPPLTGAEVSEPLIVEVVRDPPLAHGLEVAAQGRNGSGGERAHVDVEGVPEAVRARDRCVREADRLDPETVHVEAHVPPVDDTHVLNGDALPVLQTRSTDLFLLHTSFGRQGHDGLGRRQLALRHPVDPNGTAVENVVLAQ